MSELRFPDVDFSEYEEIAMKLEPFLGLHYGLLFFFDDGVYLVLNLL